MSAHVETEYILWRYNKVTGYWNVERTCTHETMEQWHRIYSEDEPGEYFYLTASNRKPRHSPIPKQI